MPHFKFKHWKCEEQGLEVYTEGMSLNGKNELENSLLPGQGR